MSASCLAVSHDDQYVIKGVSYRQVATSNSLGRCQNMDVGGDDDGGRDVGSSLESVESREVGSLGELLHRRRFVSTAADLLRIHHAGDGRDVCRQSQARPKLGNHLDGGGDSWTNESSETSINAHDQPRDLLDSLYYLPSLAMPASRMMAASPCVLVFDRPAISSLNIPSAQEGHRWQAS